MDPVGYVLIGEDKSHEIEMMYEDTLPIQVKFSLPRDTETELDAVTSGGAKVIEKAESAPKNQVTVEFSKLDASATVGGYTFTMHSPFSDAVRYTISESGRSVVVGTDEVYAKEADKDVTAIEEAYDKAINDAWEEYNAAIEKADAEYRIHYDKATADAWAAYEQESKKIQEDYDKAFNAAWAAYEAAMEAAEKQYADDLEAYSKALADAYTALEQATDDAWTAYQDADEAAQKDYEKAAEKAWEAGQEHLKYWSNGGKYVKEWLLAQCCYQALRFTVKITVA